MACAFWLTRRWKKPRPSRSCRRGTAERNRRIKALHSTRGPPADAGGCRNAASARLNSAVNWLMCGNRAEGFITFFVWRNKTNEIEPEYPQCGRSECGGLERPACSGRRSHFFTPGAERSVGKGREKNSVEPGRHRLRRHFRPWHTGDRTRIR